MLKSLRLSLVLLIICGMAYPLVVTGISTLTMPDRSKGSLIESNGKVVGSELIGQMFKDPKYFSGRVSSIEYNAAGSGSENYAPSNKDMIERTKKDIEAFIAANPDVKKGEIPADLLTNSGSGLDPHISPLAAEIQVPRIAKTRGIEEANIYHLIKEKTEGRQLGIFGEPRVNVLELNMALDQMK